MAKKTYKTYHLKGLQLLLHIEQGRTIEVNFSGGIQIESTAKYSTSNEEVQKALEKCSCFNRDFYLDSVREDEPVAAAAPVSERKAVQLVTVADKADAVEWLKENYPDKGYTATKLRTQEAFNAACEECEVVFEFK